MYSNILKSLVFSILAVIGTKSVLAALSPKVSSTDSIEPDSTPPIRDTTTANSNWLDTVSDVDGNNVLENANSEHLAASDGPCNYRSGSSVGDIADLSDLNLPTEISNPLESLETNESYQWRFHSIQYWAQLFRDATKCKIGKQNDIEYERLIEGIEELKKVENEISTVVFQDESMKNKLNDAIKTIRDEMRTEKRDDDQEEKLRQSRIQQSRELLQKFRTWRFVGQDDVSSSGAVTGIDTDFLNKVKIDPKSYDKLSSLSRLQFEYNGGSYFLRCRGLNEKERLNFSRDRANLRSSGGKGSSKGSSSGSIDYLLNSLSKRDVTVEDLLLDVSSRPDLPSSMPLTILKKVVPKAKSFLPLIRKRLNNFYSNTGNVLRKSIMKNVRLQQNKALVRALEIKKDEEERRERAIVRARNVRSGGISSEPNSNSSNGNTGSSMMLSPQKHVKKPISPVKDAAAQVITSVAPRLEFSWVFGDNIDNGISQSSKNPFTRAEKLYNDISSDKTLFDRSRYDENATISRMLLKVWEQNKGSSNVYNGISPVEIQQFPELLPSYCDLAVEDGSTGMVVEGRALARLETALNQSKAYCESQTSIGDLLDSARETATKWEEVERRKREEKKTTMTDSVTGIAGTASRTVLTGDQRDTLIRQEYLQHAIIDNEEIPENPDSTAILHRDIENELSGVNSQNHDKKLSRKSFNLAFLKYQSLSTVQSVMRSIVAEVQNLGIWEGNKGSNECGFSGLSGPAGGSSFAVDQVLLLKKMQRKALFSFAGDEKKLDFNPDSDPIEEQKNHLMELSEKMSNVVTATGMSTTVVDRNAGKLSVPPAVINYTFKAQDTHAKVKKITQQSKLELQRRFLSLRKELDGMMEYLNSSVQPTLRGLKDRWFPVERIIERDPTTGTIVINPKTGRENVKVIPIPPSERESFRTCDEVVELIRSVQRTVEGIAKASEQKILRDSREAEKLEEQKRNEMRMEKIRLKAIKTGKISTGDLSGGKLNLSEAERKKKEEEEEERRNEEDRLIKEEMERLLKKPIEKCTKRVRDLRYYREKNEGFCPREADTDVYMLSREMGGLGLTKQGGGFTEGDCDELSGCSTSRELAECQYEILKNKDVRATYMKGAIFKTLLQGLDEMGVFDDLDDIGRGGGKGGGSAGKTGGKNNTVRNIAEAAKKFNEDVENAAKVVNEDEDDTARVNPPEDENDDSLESMRKKLNSMVDEDMKDLDPNDPEYLSKIEQRNYDQLCLVRQRLDQLIGDLAGECEKFRSEWNTWFSKDPDIWSFEKAEEVFGEMKKVEKTIKEEEERERKEREGIDENSLITGEKIPKDSRYLYEENLTRNNSQVAAVKPETDEETAIRRKREKKQEEEQRSTIVKYLNPHKNLQSFAATVVGYDFIRERQQIGNSNANGIGNSDFSAEWFKKDINGIPYFEMPDRCYYTEDLEKYDVEVKEKDPNAPPAEPKNKDEDKDNKTKNAAKELKNKKKDIKVTIAEEDPDKLNVVSSSVTEDSIISDDELDGEEEDATKNDPSKNMLDINLDSDLKVSKEEYNTKKTLESYTDSKPTPNLYPEVSRLYKHVTFLPAGLSDPVHRRKLIPHAAFEVFIKHLRQSTLFHNLVNRLGYFVMSEKKLEGKKRYSDWQLGTDVGEEIGGVVNRVKNVMNVFKGSTGEVVGNVVKKGAMLGAGYALGGEKAFSSVLNGSGPLSGTSLAGNAGAEKIANKVFTGNALSVGREMRSQGVPIPSGMDELFGRHMINQVMNGNQNKNKEGNIDVGTAKMKAKFSSPDTGVIPDPEGFFSPATTSSTDTNIDDNSFILRDFREIPLADVYIRTEKFTDNELDPKPKTNFNPADIWKNIGSMIGQQLVSRVFDGATGGFAVKFAASAAYNIGTGLIFRKGFRFIQTMNENNKREQMFSSDLQESQWLQLRDSEDQERSSRDNRRKKRVIESALGLDESEGGYAENLLSGMMHMSQEEISKKLDERWFLLTKSLETCLLKNLGGIRDDDPSFFMTNTDKSSNIASISEGSTSGLSRNERSGFTASGAVNRDSFRLEDEKRKMRERLIRSLLEESRKVDIDFQKRWRKKRERAMNSLALDMVDEELRNTVAGGDFSGLNDRNRGISNADRYIKHLNDPANEEELEAVKLRLSKTEMKDDIHEKADYRDENLNTVILQLDELFQSVALDGEKNHPGLWALDLDGDMATSGGLLGNTGGRKCNICRTYHKKATGMLARDRKLQLGMDAIQSNLPDATVSYIKGNLDSYINLLQGQSRKVFSFIRNYRFSTVKVAGSGIRGGYSTKSGSGAHKPRRYHHFGVSFGEKIQHIRELSGRPENWKILQAVESKREKIYLERLENWKCRVRNYLTAYRKWEQDLRAWEGEREEREAILRGDTDDDDDDDSEVDEEESLEVIEEGVEEEDEVEEGKRDKTSKKTKSATKGEGEEEEEEDEGTVIAKNSKKKKSKAVSPVGSASSTRSELKKRTSVTATPVGSASSISAKKETATPVGSVKSTSSELVVKEPSASASVTASIDPLLPALTEPATAIPILRARPTEPIKPPPEPITEGKQIDFHSLAKFSLEFFFGEIPQHIVKEDGSDENSRSRSSSISDHTKTPSGNDLLSQEDQNRLDSHALESRLTVLSSTNLDDELTVLERRLGSNHPKVLANKFAAWYVRTSGEEVIRNLKKITSQMLEELKLDLSNCQAREERSSFENTTTVNFDVTNLNEDATDDENDKPNADQELKWELKCSYLANRGLPYVRVIDGVENGFVSAQDMMMLVSSFVLEKEIKEGGFHGEDGTGTGEDVAQKRRNEVKRQMQERKKAVNLRIKNMKKYAKESKGEIWSKGRVIAERKRLLEIERKDVIKGVSIFTVISEEKQRNENASMTKRLSSDADGPRRRKIAKWVLAWFKNIATSELLTISQNVVRGRMLHPLWVMHLEYVITQQLKKGYLVETEKGFPAVGEDGIRVPKVVIAFKHYRKGSNGEGIGSGSSKMGVNNGADPAEVRAVNNASKIGNIAGSENSSAGFDDSDGGSTTSSVLGDLKNLSPEDPTSTITDGSSFGFFELKDYSLTKEINSVSGSSESFAKQLVDLRRLELFEDELRQFSVAIETDLAYVTEEIKSSTGQLKEREEGFYRYLFTKKQVVPYGFAMRLYKSEDVIQGQYGVSSEYGPEIRAQSVADIDIGNQIAEFASENLQIPSTEEYSVEGGKVSENIDTSITNHLSVFVNLGKRSMTSLEKLIGLLVVEAFRGITTDTGDRKSLIQAKLRLRADKHAGINRLMRESGMEETGKGKGWEEDVKRVRKLKMQLSMESDEGYDSDGESTRAGTDFDDSDDDSVSNIDGSGSSGIDSKFEQNIYSNEYVWPYGTSSDSGNGSGPGLLSDPFILKAIDEIKESTFKLKEKSNNELSNSIVSTSGAKSALDRFGLRETVERKYVNLDDPEVIREVLDGVNRYFEMDREAQFLSEIMIIGLQEGFSGKLYQEPLNQNTAFSNGVIRVLPRETFIDKHDKPKKIDAKTGEIIFDPYRKQIPFGRKVILLRSAVADISGSATFLALTENVSANRFFRREALRASLRDEILSWNEIRARYDSEYTKLSLKREIEGGAKSNAALLQVERMNLENKMNANGSLMRMGLESDSARIAREKLESHLFVEWKGGDSDGRGDGEHTSSAVQLMDLDEVSALLSALPVSQLESLISSHTPGVSTDIAKLKQMRFQRRQELDSKLKFVAQKICILDKSNRNDSKENKINYMENDRLFLRGIEVDAESGIPESHYFRLPNSKQICSSIKGLLEIWVENTANGNMSVDQLKQESYYIEHLIHNVAISRSKVFDFATLFEDSVAIQNDGSAQEKLSMENLINLNMLTRNNKSTGKNSFAKNGSKSLAIKNTKKDLQRQERLLDGEETALGSTRYLNVAQMALDVVAGRFGSGASGGGGSSSGIGGSGTSGISSSGPSSLFANLILLRMRSLAQEETILKIFINGVKKAGSSKNLRRENAIKNFDSYAEKKAGEENEKIDRAINGNDLDDDLVIDDKDDDDEPIPAVNLQKAIQPSDLVEPLLTEQSLRDWSLAIPKVYFGIVDGNEWGVRNIDVSRPYWDMDEEVGDSIIGNSNGDHVGANRISYAKLEANYREDEFRVKELERKKKRREEVVEEERKRREEEEEAMKKLEEEKSDEEKEEEEKIEDDEENKSNDTTPKAVTVISVAAYDQEDEELEEAREKLRILGEILQENKKKERFMLDPCGEAYMVNTKYSKCKTRWKNTSVERLVYVGNSGSINGSNGINDGSSSESESMILKPPKFAFVAYSVRNADPKSVAKSLTERDPKTIFSNENLEKKLPGHSLLNILVTKDAEDMIRKHLRRARSGIRSLRSFGDFKEYIHSAIVEIQSTSSSNDDSNNKGNGSKLDKSINYFPPLLDEASLNQLNYFLQLMEEHLSRHENPEASREHNAFFGFVKRELFLACDIVERNTLEFYQYSRRELETLARQRVAKEALNDVHGLNALTQKHTKTLTKLAKEKSMWREIGNFYRSMRTAEKQLMQILIALQRQEKAIQIAKAEYNTEASNLIDKLDPLMVKMILMTHQVQAKIGNKVWERPGNLLNGPNNVDDSDGKWLQLHIAEVMNPKPLLLPEIATTNGVTIPNNIQQSELASLKSLKQNNHALLGFEHAHQWGKRGECRENNYLCQSQAGLYDKDDRIVQGGSTMSSRDLVLLLRSGNSDLAKSISQMLQSSANAYDQQEKRLDIAVEYGGEEAKENPGLKNPSGYEGGNIKITELEGNRKLWKGYILVNSSETWRLTRVMHEIIEKGSILTAKAEARHRKRPDWNRKGFNQIVPTAFVKNQFKNLLTISEEEEDEEYYLETRLALHPPPESAPGDPPILPTEKENRFKKDHIQNEKNKLDNDYLKEVPASEASITLSLTGADLMELYRSFPHGDCDCGVSGSDKKIFPKEELGAVEQDIQFVRKSLLIQSWGLMGSPPTKGEIDAKWRKEQEKKNIFSSGGGSASSKYMDTTFKRNFKHFNYKAAIKENNEVKKEKARIRKQELASAGRNLDSKCPLVLHWLTTIERHSPEIEKDTEFLAMLENDEIEKEILEVENDLMMESEKEGYSSTGKTKSSSSKDTKDDPTKARSGTILSKMEEASKKSTIINQQSQQEEKWVKLVADYPLLEPRFGTSDVLREWDKGRIFIREQNKKRASAARENNDVGAAKDYAMKEHLFSRTKFAAAIRKKRMEKMSEEEDRAREEWKMMTGSYEVNFYGSGNGNNGIKGGNSRNGGANKDKMSPEDRLKAAVHPVSLKFSKDGPVDCEMSFLLQERREDIDSDAKRTNLQLRYIKAKREQRERKRLKDIGITDPDTVNHILNNEKKCALLTDIRLSGRLMDNQLYHNAARRYLNPRNDNANKDLFLKNRTKKSVFALQKAIDNSLIDPDEGLPRLYKAFNQHKIHDESGFGSLKDIKEGYLVDEKLFNLEEELKNKEKKIGLSGIDTEFYGTEKSGTGLSLSIGGIESHDIYKTPQERIEEVKNKIMLRRKDPRLYAEEVMMKKMREEIERRKRVKKERESKIRAEEETKEILAGMEGIEKEKTITIIEDTKPKSMFEKLKSFVGKGSSAKTMTTTIEKTEADIKIERIRRKNEFRSKMGVNWADQDSPYGAVTVLSGVVEIRLSDFLNLPIALQQKLRQNAMVVERDWEKGIVKTRYSDDHFQVYPSDPSKKKKKNDYGNEKSQDNFKTSANKKTQSSSKKSKDSKPDKKTDRWGTTKTKSLAKPTKNKNNVAKGGNWPYFLVRGAEMLSFGQIPAHNLSSPSLNSIGNNSATQAQIDQLLITGATTGSPGTATINDPDLIAEKLQALNTLKSFPLGPAEVISSVNYGQRWFASTAKDLDIEGSWAKNELERQALSSEELAEGWGRNENGGIAGVFQLNDPFSKEEMELNEEINLLSETHMINKINSIPSEEDRIFFQEEPASTLFTPIYYDGAKTVLAFDNRRRYRNPFVLKWSISPLISPELRPSTWIVDDIKELRRHNSYEFAHLQMKGVSNGARNVNSKSLISPPARNVPSIASGSVGGNNFSPEIPSIRIKVPIKPEFHLDA